MDKTQHSRPISNTEAKTIVISKITGEVNLA